MRQLGEYPLLRALWQDSRLSCLLFLPQQTQLRPACSPSASYPWPN